ncbi:hypothetical protein F5Y17DRAFT_107925 [Xylariaceae sp. FL0594]|nr:hypothetical protein F5Y17DRAFT_107925 [Xylariaceae sp. FL0594]
MMITDATTGNSASTPTTTPCPHSDGKGLPRCWDCAEEGSTKNNNNIRRKLDPSPTSWQTLEWPERPKPSGGMVAGNPMPSPTTLPEVHHPEPGLEVHKTPPAGGLEVVDGPWIVHPDEKFWPRPPRSHHLTPQAWQYHYPPPQHLQNAEISSPCGLVSSPDSYSFHPPAFSPQPQPLNQHQHRHEHQNLSYSQAPTGHWNGTANGSGNSTGASGVRSVTDPEGNSAWDEISSTMRTNRSTSPWHGSGSNNGRNTAFSDAGTTQTVTGTAATAAAPAGGAASRGGNPSGGHHAAVAATPSDDGVVGDEKGGKGVVKILGARMSRKTLYILIAVAVLAIIAVVVGVAVGVTQGTKAHSATSGGAVITQTVSLYIGANGSTSFITLAATTTTTTTTATSPSRTAPASSSPAILTAVTLPPTSATSSTSSSPSTTAVPSSSYTGNNSSRVCIGADGSTVTDAATGARFRLECTVEHRGTDLLNIEAGSMTACVALCAQNSRCAGAVWYNVGPQGTDLNYCWLKTQMLSQVDVRADAQSVVRL